MSSTGVIGFSGVVALVILAACGSTSPSNSFGSGNSGLTCTPATQGTLTAVIDNGPFTATCVTASRTASGPNFTLTVAGANATTSIGLSISATGPGTFTVAAAAFTGLVGLVPPSGAWTASLNDAGTSGSVTLTRFDTTGAVGTFFFTAAPTSGTVTGTKTVTGGSFSVSY